MNSVNLEMQCECVICDDHKHKDKIHDSVNSMEGSTHS